MTEDRLVEIEQRYLSQILGSFRLKSDLQWLIAEVKRLREEMAEWESAHTAVVELRGLVESHMDTARGEWECVATIERLQTAILTLTMLFERLQAEQRLLDESVRNQAIRETIHKEELKRLRKLLEARSPYCAQHGEYQPCSQHQWVPEQPC
jgi:hypothetical protein